MKICVIGAGAGGLVAAKSLLEDGHEVVVFEKTDKIGGIWNDKTFCYPSLHTNVSKWMTAFSDFPFPKHYQDHPHHSQVKKYLEEYARHFHINGLIQFNSTIVRLEYQGNESTPPNKLWKVECHSNNHLTTNSLISQHFEFDAIVACHGQYHEPALPAYPGLDKFSSAVLHSSEYSNLLHENPNFFQGKKVVIVGKGSSGADIARDLATEESQASSHPSSSTFLSFRSRLLLRPKLIEKWSGISPFDTLYIRLFLFLPQFVYDLLKKKYIRIFGSQLTNQQENNKTTTKTNPDQPTTRMNKRFPIFEKVTASNTLANLIDKGCVHLKPDISHFEDNWVHFVDGTKESVDVVIFCTGYRRTFPFLEKEIALRFNVCFPLYQHVFVPGIPTLAFVGLPRQKGSAFGIVEMQSRWIAALFTGKIDLPSEEHMNNWIQEKNKEMKERGCDPAQIISSHQYADDLARFIGCSPIWWKHPSLIPGYFLLPMVNAWFRLDGVGKKTCSEIYLYSLQQNWLHLHLLLAGFGFTVVVAWISTFLFL